MLSAKRDIRSKVIAPLPTNDPYKIGFASATHEKSTSASPFLFFNPRLKEAKIVQ